MHIMNMSRIKEIIYDCSFFKKLAEESFPKSRITQLNSMISNNFCELTTIEKLYVGLEMALSAFNEIVEYADNLEFYKPQGDA